MKKCLLLLFCFVFCITSFSYADSKWNMNKTINYICVGDNAIPEAKTLYNKFLSSGGKREEMISFLDDVSKQLMILDQKENITENNIETNLSSVLKDLIFSSKYSSLRKTAEKIYFLNKDVLTLDYLSSIYENNKDSFNYLIFDEPDIFGIMSNDIVFFDIKKSDWSYEYISKLFDMGVINGNENGNFLPQNKISRAEFSKILALSLGYKTGNAYTVFNDVNPLEWYAPYIGWCSEKGYINGFSNQVFKPNENISREEMATIIGRVLEKKLPNNSEIVFNDNQVISDYAVKYVSLLANSKIISGDEFNNFNPQGLSTREETAKVICNMLGLLEN